VPEPLLGVSYDANNHQLGLSYDANRNQLSDAQNATMYGWTVVSVSDGTTSMECPTVIGSATLDLSLKNGRLQDMGNRTRVLSVVNP